MRGLIEVLRWFGVLVTVNGTVAGVSFAWLSLTDGRPIEGVGFAALGAGAWWCACLLVGVTPFARWRRAD